MKYYWTPSSKTNIKIARKYLYSYSTVNMWRPSHMTVLLTKLKFPKEKKVLGLKSLCYMYSNSVSILRSVLNAFRVLNPFLTLVKKNCNENYCDVLLMCQSLSNISTQSRKIVLSTVNIQPKNLLLSGLTHTIKCFCLCLQETASHNKWIDSLCITNRPV